MNRPAIIAGAVAGGLLLHAAIVMPSHPAGLVWARFLRPSWELPAILLVVVLWPGRPVRAIVVALALGLVCLRAADLGTHLAFARPFNPLLDAHLLVSGWSLLASSVGRAQALLAVSGLVIALAGLAALLWACLAVLPRRGQARFVLPALPAALLCIALVLPGWAAFRATPVVAAQIARIADGVTDLAAFTRSLSRPPGRAPGFAALAGRDVIIAFVESYGRAFLDDTRFRDVSAPRLLSVEDRLARAGWSVASGWSAAPTRGGQSWLSHATLLSGLWVDSQTRYDRLMTSQFSSLNGAFRAAGWRTGAVMPAITLDWPEGAWFGYDTTLAAADLGYAGVPFEWVTMPDQYSWSAMDRLLRHPGPDMIEMALVTSHAPWTPLPRIVDWEEIGDGAIFDDSLRDGASPREVWSDPDRIRAQYALSLDYALEVAGQYIAKFGDGALFVLVGDHQPAPLLTGPDASPDVPVHIVTDTPSLLARLPSDVFTPGIVPAPDGRSLPMDALRDLFETAFETPQPVLEN